MDLAPGDFQRNRHAEQEFEAIGVPFRKRGQVANEYLEAMFVLWSQDRPAFKGEFVSFDGICFEPKPVQSPHPPDKPHDTFSSPQEVIDAIGALQDMGVTWSGIPFPGSSPKSLSEHLDQLAWGAETVIPLFRV
jgi:alkanesulfonate monooxygenase SsuD/methylene tetrahydromethanopterin reductase-like flavin-dependent oxidoreductase (luciferase family)